jgi:hypothetical protein
MCSLNNDVQIDLRCKSLKDVLANPADLLKLLLGREHWTQVSASDLRGFENAQAGTETYFSSGRVFAIDQDMLMAEFRPGNGTAVLISDTWLEIALFVRPLAKHEGTLSAVLLSATSQAELRRITARVLEHFSLKPLCC